MSCSMLVIRKTNNVVVYVWILLTFIRMSGDKKIYITSKQKKNLGKITSCTSRLLHTLVE